MKRLAGLLCCAALAVRAEDTRVERRLLVKETHTFLSGGLAWLERGDGYLSPGAFAEAIHYPSESLGLQLRAVAFASSPTSGTQDVVSSTGLALDARKPSFALLGQVRFGLAYGKLAVAGSVLHFDVEALAGGGFLGTDDGFEPSLTGGIGFLLRFGDRLYGTLDVPLIGSLESRRDSSVAFGVLPSFALGMRL